MTACYWTWADFTYLRIFLFWTSLVEFAGIPFMYSFFFLWRKVNNGTNRLCCFYCDFNLHLESNEEIQTKLDPNLCQETTLNENSEPPPPSYTDFFSKWLNFFYYRCFHWRKKCFAICVRKSFIEEIGMMQIIGKSVL